MGGRQHPRHTRAVRRGEGEAGKQGERTGFTGGRERQKRDLFALGSLAADVDQMPNGLLARRLRRPAGPHRRDYARTARNARDLFANPG